MAPCENRNQPRSFFACLFVCFSRSRPFENRKQLLKNDHYPYLTRPITNPVCVCVCDLSRERDRHQIGSFA